MQISVGPQSVSTVHGCCAPQPRSRAVLPHALMPAEPVKQTHVSLPVQKLMLPQVVAGLQVLAVGRAGATQVVNVEVTVSVPVIVGVSVTVVGIYQGQ
jgi:hypothetical protein